MLSGFLPSRHCTSSECVVCCRSAWLSVAVLQVEIGGVKIRVAGQPLEIVDEQNSALVVDHARFAELLKRSVDVHRGETKRLRKHVLSQGNVAAGAVADPGRPAARV